MTEAKRVVILANSRKPPGRCVAGIEIAGTHVVWVRPVGDVYGAGLKPWERRLPDGSEPLPLDVVDFVVARHVPVDCHSENWLVDADRPRRRAGTFGFDDLNQLVSDPDTLWTNDEETVLGLNDLVAEAELENFADSILLLGPQRLVLSAHTNRWSEKQELRATFAHRGVRYRLKVTDPVYEDRYLTGEDGEFVVPTAYLTISLGEPWPKPGSEQLYSSKLVAAVIEPSGGNS
jgi:hypothetical protein